MPEPNASASAREGTRLAAILEAARALATREGRWRKALTAQIAPSADDVIVELGCGAGGLAIDLALAAPGAHVIGVEADEKLVARARERAAQAGVRVEFLRGLPQHAAHLLNAWAPVKIAASFVPWAATLSEKRALIAAARATLRGGGSLHLADYGPQRTPLMRTLLRAAQRFQSVDNTPHLARALIESMRAEGFVAVAETESFPTPAGSISLFHGRIS